MTAPARLPQDRAALALSLPDRPRRVRRTAFIVLAAALLGMILLNVGMGETNYVTPRVVLQVLGRHVPFLAAHIPPLPDTLQNADGIVWEQRLPRTLGGALIGMLLAMAGVAFQSFLMNPLADPYMVGVSAGAALGSVVVILLGGAGLLAGAAQPLAAFASGLLAMVAVTLLARRNGRVSAQTFLLAGIVVGTFLWNLIPLTLALANRSGNFDRQSQILSQLLGSLTLLGWNTVLLLLPFGVVGGLLLWLAAPELDIMTLGEETAARLGVDTEAFKRRIVIAGSLATAAAVAAAGIIGFVGLIVPHIARRLVGPKHVTLLPMAMLLGGLVLVVADWLSRVVLQQLEIGVITALIGAPAFCVLLRKRLVPR